MPTEKYAGVVDVRFCSGLSASHDCKAKTTATLGLFSDGSVTKRRQHTSQPSYGEVMGSEMPDWLMRTGSMGSYLFRVKICGTRLAMQQS